MSSTPLSPPLPLILVFPCYCTLPKSTVFHLIYPSYARCARFFVRLLAPAMSLALDGDSASIHTLYKRLESRMRKVKKQLQREMRNLNRSHTLNQHEDTLTHWAKSYGPLPHTTDPHDTREEPVRTILKQANDDLGWWESHLGLTVAPKYMA